MAQARSGQITITTAGTAVQGPADSAGTTRLQTFALQGHPANTQNVYVGNDGADDVSSANGYPLAKGQEIIVQVRSLQDLWFDAEVSGEKVCWLLLD